VGRVRVLSVDELAGRCPSITIDRDVRLAMHHRVRTIALKLLRRAWRGQLQSRKLSMLFGEFSPPRGDAAPPTGPIVARHTTTKCSQLDIWCRPKQSRLSSHFAVDNLLVADAMVVLQLRIDGVYM
jgi:hypothetical protein